MGLGCQIKPGTYQNTKSEPTSMPCRAGIASSLVPYHLWKSRAGTEGFLGTEGTQIQRPSRVTHIVIQGNH